MIDKGNRLPTLGRRSTQPLLKEIQLALPKHFSLNQFQSIHLSSSLPATSYCGERGRDRIFSLGQTFCEISEINHATLGGFFKPRIEWQHLYKRPSWIENCVRF